MKAILRRRTFYALCAVAVVVLFAGAWISGRVVLAFKPDKTAHIFPVTVTAEGWQNVSLVRSQELAENAQFDAFSPENSAYIILEKTERPLEPEESEEPEAPTEQQEPDATSSEPLPGEESQPAASSTDPVVVEEQPEPEPSEDIPAEEETATSTDSDADDAAVSPDPAGEPSNEEPATTTATTSDELSAAPGAFSNLRQILSAHTESVFAQEENVAACTSLGIPCRTVQLSGFEVGELDEMNLRSVNINFSFGSAAQEADEDSRLLLRYFHDGEWRDAGELFLNKEFSNAENGGYFSYTIEDISDWEDLSDLSVVFEYVPGDVYAGAEVYLDSVWIDAVYREPVQDILQGETEEPVVPENVSFTLSGTGTDDPRVLKISADTSIEFSYTDDAEDALFMRSDGFAYAAREDAETPGEFTSIANVSITNTGASADTFTLFAAAPQGSIRSVEQFMRNVPRVISTPLYEEATHTCLAEWESSGEAYTCPESGELRACVELSTDGKDCVFNDEVGTEEATVYENGWVSVDVENDPTDAFDIPEGYQVIGASARSFAIESGQTLYFRVKLSQPDPGESTFYFYAEGDSYEGDLDSRELKEESLVLSDAMRDKPRVNELLSGLQQFEGSELPEFTFKFTSQRSLLMRFFSRLLGQEREFTFGSARLMDSGGNEEEVPVDIEYGEGGEWTLHLKKHPRAFRPGAYTLEYTIKDGSEEYTETIEFFWGVLAVNTNKSIYAPGEDVRLYMAALDDAGDTICDAILGLTITDPSGSSRIVPVRETGECGPNNVIASADYASDYTTSGVGTYGVTLVHMTEDGRILRRITDSFEVRDVTPFVIERTGATRIWPVANYRMTLELTAREDFAGQFVEAMPEDFVIVDAGGGESDIYGGAKRLAWDVDLKAGESVQFTYEYDAPDISPYLYLLGPAEVRQGDGIPFSESRQWKVASDAVGNLLLYWDNTYIPSGWTCVSCVGGDAFFQRFVVGSSTPGVNGGAATHTHTATGAVTQTGTGGDSDTGGGGADVALNTHTHNYTPIIDSPSNLPPYRNLVIIQANTTGEVQIPAGAIAIFDVASSSLPSGWFRYSAQDGRYTRGEAVANRGTTGGSATHTHAITGSTDAAVGGTNASGAGASIATPTHTHTVSTTTVSVNNEPRYIEALLARITATSTAPDGMIGMWTGDTFTGWDIVSSSSQAFENRFVKASTTYGGTGGSDTHTHTNITGIVSGQASASVSRTTTGASDAVLAHTHAVDVTSFSTSNHLPPYRTAVFAKRLGGATPLAPTIHTPFESEKTGTSTPRIEFTATDPDGTDSLVYQVQWDDDADLDVSPIGDRTSSVETGCSPNCFENTVSGGDTSPFNEGERIRFTIQTPLVSGTTYYFRVRAKDAGSSFGAWATTTSFTYVGNTSPSQWFQTEDAQFETGTLSDTETFGSDAVRILAADPVEALIAYGEGVVQTPRYQIWTGTTTSGELSAQSVGGTIQWIITKAAPTRDEYVLGTQDASNDVNVQVYNGVADTWGNLLEVTASVSDITARGFDIAYESQSGDAVVVYCDGDADPSYYVWNGSSWTSGGTINLTSANVCEYIKLAADPVSDEIILVARDTAAGATDYEALVWDGSAWGNSVTMGNMSDTLNEGIAVEYEESGNQAVAAVSNGDTNGFIWAAWNGTEWSVPTAQALGDDFEWGIMKRDVGTDNMALCYADQDDDLGVVRWDGGAWATTQEFDTAGNTAGDGTVDGRPVSCEFEITSGRDGYLMLAYSNTTQVEYDYMDDPTGFAGGAALATINDSWTVGTTRTGEGKVLMVAWDDANTQYDFSYWNGSSWAADVTLEGSPSVTAEPFREPVHMAAQIYQPASGSITSDPVAFSLVSGQPTWGEVLWNTTEPSGTDVKLQVLYATSTQTCPSYALVPEGVGGLTGNAAGFQATSSPLDLSGLSTTTYSQLCVRATLTSASQNNPTLNDWSISWERQPYLTQTNYRWYVNSASSLTPTDPWPSGGTDLNENDAISASFAPVSGATLRLRMNILTENVGLSAGSLVLRMQYAVGTSCSADMTWQNVGAIGSTTAAWRGLNNASLSDGATLPSTLLSSSDVSGTYEEENDSAVNPGTASTNQETEWDWVLQHNGAAGTGYCFRVITDSDQPLNEYDRYPQLVTNQRPNAPVLEKLFDNEQVASTTPWFEFAGEDPESNDITYQIQIDDDIDLDTAPTIDQNSQSNQDDFTNIVTPADRDPFTTGQTVRYIPASSLSNNTTYYWRVRGKDRNASNTWSDWSTIQSFTINTGTAVTTWFQTTEEQFDTNSHEDTEATSTDEVVLTPPQTTGTTTSSMIDFDWKTTGNAWGSLSWTDTETTSDIKYHIEYLNGSTWELIPDADLPNNAAGHDNTNPVSLLGVDPQTYNQIRIRANLTNSGATPRLQDWQVQWGFAVSQPTQHALFDNEKTGTTTPTFRFESEDPDNEDLVYQISWSTTPDFAASTTRESSAHSGFANTASSTDTSPFVSGDIVRFTVQSGDALSNGTTYWWRVRARDSGGANVWSVWSPHRSFTVDTSVTVSTWFQTTDEQFETSELNDIETTGSDSVQITSTIREALTAYAEGTAQVPRYRIWNGTSWGAEASAQSIGDTIRFIEAAASPTRDEYIITTMGSTGVVDAQIFNGGTGTWGNMTEVVAAVSDTTQRGFDVAYETDSGDALAVACSGTEATYKVWNGSSWSGSNSITLSVSANCEWVKLASDPESDEIIAVFRDATTGATDYEALVWSGSAWGNSMTMGSQVAANNEGIAVEYEESGDQAVVAVSNGAGNNFIYNRWNGSWQGTNTVAIGNDFASARLCRDDGSDAMAIGYIDIDNDVGYALWNGSTWGASAEFEALGNNQNGRPVSCEFETTSARDGFTMFPYSDTTQAESVFWNGSVLSGATIISTITDSWEVRTARTGDGNILALFYDDANTEYDFSYWNGSVWSAEQVLDTTSITVGAPATIPLDIVARRYPTFTTGSVVSDAIDFDDGTGLKWDEALWSKTTPGSSSIRMQVQYASSSGEWLPVPDSVIPGNSSGTTTSPINLGDANFTTYNQLRLVADFTCVAGNCPTMSDWTLTWSPGLEVSGTAKQYDQSTNVTSGTVAIAVNGVLQVGKTATISGGSWNISNVTVFPGDTVTVFVDSAASSNRAVAVTKYDGTGDISGLELIERHLSLGSNDNPTVANVDLAQYDTTLEGDIFHDVDGGNDLTACAIAGCSDVEVWIRSGTTYRPDGTSSGNVSTHDIEINGTLVGDGNTVTVSGSWDNNGSFTPNTSTVVFSATSTTETVDSTGAASPSFNNVTFGTSNSGTWTLSSALDVNGNLAVNFGTFSKGSQALTIAGNLSIGSSGTWLKGSATTTFDGSSTGTWSDSTVSKQDIGKIAVDGSAKTLQLGSGVKATDITIGSDDTLSVTSSNHALEVQGNWVNNNSFQAHSGTVTFTATTTGRTITAGGSSFHNLSFNGVGGNWAFTASTLSIGNDLTIATGTLTMPTATTTLAGSFNNSGGTFQHNNGVILFTAAGAKTINQGNSNFFDMTFSGSGSWSFTTSNATSSRHVTITNGTLTLPSSAFAIGGSFVKNGGSFVHNSGTLRFTASTAQIVRLNNSDAFNLTFAGSGSWSFFDTNATTTNTVRIENGTATLPSGVFAVGGSWQGVGGAFTHNSGTVKFNSSDTGETISPNGSWFSTLRFDGAGGGWTIAQSATSSASTTIAQASAFTLSSGQSLAVGGGFTNSVGSTTTTWSGSTLRLYSGNSYSINTKTGNGDTYGTLNVGTNTDVKMWNSDASATSVDPSGSLYSQDHAAQDGDLYIWGDYQSNGNEFWSYATDFDGTSLGGSSRQVDVRFAADAVFTHATATLQILGSSSATTTLANQGSGTYAMRVSGGTLNAEYYSVRNTNLDGLYLLGAPTITSLARGDFELGVNGGSVLSVAGSVINANPAMQIQEVRFATSSGISSGYNVSATTTATSYWWFRNHYGNYASENYDNDDGNPGRIRFDDSSFSITVSGTVYSDRGQTEMGSPTCDDTTPVVRIVVNGGTSFAGSCDSGDGSFSIPNVLFSGDAVLTAYLDTNGGERAVTVTRTPTTDITDFDLYARTLIARHESTGALGIVHLSMFDSGDDSDVFFAASSSLVVAPANELHIWTGKTFAPAGNVTLQGGGNGDSRDGRLHLAANSVFTAAGTQTHSIGGDFVLESGSTFTAASSTLTFAATTSKSITLTPALTLWNVDFNGSGGTWNLTGATTTIQGSSTISAGTLGGTGNIVVESGAITGNGSIAMTGGTVNLRGTGNFGGNGPWQFYNLTLGDASSTRTTTKTGTGTTTALGVLRVATNHTLNAGSSGWNLAGSSTPLVRQGTFNVQSAPFYYTSSSNTNVADETYALLVLAPAAAGSPTYAVMGGTLTADDLTVGGANPVTVTADTNDPTMIVTDDVLINSGATLVASNVGAFEIAGGWQNNGTFTHSGGTVLFESTDTGETISVGSSPFFDVEFDSAGGGWTITGNATSSRNFELTNASSFTLQSGAVLNVGGAFTNLVGGAATTWTGSTLALRSGTSYAINTKTAGDDVYGDLLVASSTDVSMWHSSSTAVSVASGSSLYSQDHANQDGDLYIWGDYERSSGSGYWSYESDFDGTSLAGSERQVDVRVASSSTVTLSGGVLDIIGGASASTTIDTIGNAGAFTFSVSGGTLNAQFYSFRHLTAQGLQMSGSPTITSLSDGDLELAHTGGSLMTVAGSVIDANPLKILMRNRFGTSTGVTSGTNVTATGVTGSSWKFNLHYGDIDGESFDSDPTGDPGYLRWDDSASNITISGNVYSDEGTTPIGGPTCDGSTQTVVLKVQGGGSFSSSCDASTGAYSIPNVNYNPGDVLTVFLDTGGGARAANISVDPNTNISNMHLYQNRTIVRHEDSAPINIADMAIYDSTHDTDIPFNAATGTPDTLTLPPGQKLIVWTGKTFAPAGNITLQSGGTGGAVDGTLEMQATSTFSAAGTQTHTIGGSILVGSGGSISPAQSTFVLAATTTGKTIQPQTSSFYNLTFNGVGGNWAFSGGNATTTRDFTITNGTVTLPTGTTTVGGSFQNTGGTFQHNNGAVVFTATTTGKSVRANASNFYSLSFASAAGGWTIVDTNATTSNNVLITAGAVTLPSGTLAVGGSFHTATSSASFSHSSGTLRLTSSSAGKTLQGGSSNFNHVTFDGSGGAWVWSDATSTANNVTIVVGSTTLPTALSVSGSFVNSGGSFYHNVGTITFNAGATGRSITPGGSWFNNITFNSSSGGWTITQNATSSGNFTLTSANSFTQTPGTTLAIGSVFTNSVGGSATVWSGTKLSLYGATTSVVNTKAQNGDVYNTLTVGANTDVRMWNSFTGTTTVDSTGSLYSQDNANASGTPQDGDLYIWGDYLRSSGSEYWSYATDFDGAALGGSSRQVDVRVASSSVLTFLGGTLEIVGNAGNVSSIDVQGTGAYAIDVIGGTLNASYYQFRHVDGDGLNLAGSTAVTSLSNGDFELASQGGAMITVSNDVIDANAGILISNVAFATSSGITSGFNVKATGTPVAAWDFTAHSGNYDGEAFDSDGATACGNIRWDDSACLFVSEEHYRWRNDDGGEGAPSSEWFDGDWSRRKRITVSNPTAENLTDVEVRIDVTYDSDMQADFDDLRFTDASGTTSINYWIEEFTTSASSTVWLEIPSLPANGQAVTYMYYGNGSVLTTGDGEVTFDYFDDFEDDDISEYSGNTTLFNVGTDFNYIGSYGLDAFGDEDQKTTGGILRTGSLFSQNTTIRYFQYVDTTAGAEDAPCTLFAVGGSGSNYAVCLNQFETDKVFVSEDVISNEAEGSGTVIASSTVDFASAGSGWYEVEIDWLSSGNQINVTVYDPSGSVLTTVNTSDGSHTSAAGAGFTYWGQHGGWDFYSVRHYFAAEPSYVFSVEQQSDGASWRAAEDTFVTVNSGTELEQNIRLRFSIQNTGANKDDQEYRIQIASKGASLSCEAVPHNAFADVPVAGSCASSPACMSGTSNFTDQAPTTELLSSTANLTFTTGSLVEDTSNSASVMDLTANHHTELEYNFQMTQSAVGSAYCFRVYEAGANDDLDNYESVAEMRMVHSPFISNWALNGGLDIALTEGVTTTVSATGTVTDFNGYTDIVSSTSTLFRSLISGGEACSANDNNCYRIATSSCSLSSCSGNSCTLTCSAPVQYHADPTDVGSLYEAENWVSSVRVNDSSGAFDTASSTGVDLLSLFGLSVVDSIAYGSLGLGESSTTTASTTVFNTGNTNIDLELQGTALGSIEPNNQKFATSTFVYASCSICQFLTGGSESPAGLDVDLPKPTSTSTPITDEVYWGINVPATSTAGNFLGTNTFWATAE